MLVVRIELWPYGIEAQKRVLAEGRIANDGTGTLSQGNYKVALSDKAGRTWKTGAVRGFPRKRLLAWDLLCRALYEILGERNSLKPESESDASS